MKAWFKAEDDEEARRLAKAFDLCRALWEFQNYLRDWGKYEGGKRTADEVSDKFYEILNSNSIDLEDIYT